MKNLTLLFLLAFFSIPLLQAQEVDQHISYEIKVNLDTANHLISGDLTLNYQHNGNSSLDSIFFYLYPNAYSHPLTSFGKQQLKLGNEEFYFANKKERGFISDLSFSENQNVETFQLTGRKDIGFITLKEPLKSGESIRLTTEFTVQIPALFSRLGYEKNIYQISQWFPKVAKHTSDGWKKYSYLDMGEFYSEFADYKVEITLPSDYIVASTGELKNTIEKNWYLDLSKDNSVPSPYSSKTKTLQYTAENVQDFAWFASKSFHVQHSTTQIDEKDIDCWVFHQYPSERAWSQALHFTERALMDFSEWVGPYQYPQMTVVGANLKSGAGMEYPMISLIGQSGSAMDIDNIIAHEIGHNWFYGMIASDERQYPYLDEAITSQLEMRYIKKYYPDTSHSDYAHDAFPYPIEQYYFWDRLQVNYPLDISASLSNQSEMAYYLTYYRLAPQAYEYLRLIEGDTAWDKMMHTLYDQYLFKHLSPRDFQSHLNNNLEHSIDWIFNDYLIGEKSFDYTFQRVREKDDSLICHIRNNSALMAPIMLRQYKDDSVLWEERYPAFANVDTLVIPQFSRADSLTIYTGSLFTAYNDRRSYKIKSSEIESTKTKLRLLIGYEPPEINSIFYTPIVGYNVTDGFMIGATFHNITLPRHRFQFQLLPYYGFNSQDIVGILDMHYDIHKSKNNLNRLRFSLKSRRFHYDYNEHYGYENSYVKIAPELNYRWKQSPVNYNTTDFNLRAVYINQKKGIGEDYETKEFYYDRDNYTILEGKITRSNHHPISPYSISLTGQASESAWRTTLEATSSYKFAPQFRIGGRIFAGLSSSRENGFPSLQFFTSGTPSFAAMDYMHDAFLLDRTAENGVFSQQIFNRDIGMPLPVVFPLGSEVIGGNFYLRYNTGFIAIEPYYYWSYTGSDAIITPFVSSFGSRITLADDIIEINFPFYSTDAVVEAMELQGHDSYLEKITFSVDFGRLLPDKLLRDLFNVE